MVILGKSNVSILVREREKDSGSCGGKERKSGGNIRKY